MGRAPCCDKANVKKGPWSPEEDAKLKSYIDCHGTGGNWIALPQKIGLKRCGKSCRLRWLNYLRPNLKHGGFSEEEDNIICSLYMSIGSRWSIIAAQLPGRTDNDIKNYWNTRLKKKLLGKQRKEQQARRGTSHVKQEMKRENENSMVPDAMNLYPYWQDLPVAMCEDPNLKDQASMKDLVVKLGTRFSNDHQQQNPTTNFQYPNYDIITTQDQLYHNSMNPINNTQYIINGGTLTNLQGFDYFPVELDEIVYGNSQQFEGFSGVEMVNGGSTGTSSTENSWGDISPLGCPPMVPNYEDGRQGMLQNYGFEESRYPGMQ